jgi:hypothetical protein
VLPVGFHDLKKEKEEKKHHIFASKPISGAPKKSIVERLDLV